MCSAGRCARLTFPKLMHWDAMLDDGQGELLFGRPIRWILFIYGGRVVPFTISRTPARADRAGAGRHHRRGHLRPPVSHDQRAGGAGHQGALVRRVPRAAARELRHPRAQRASQQDRAASSTRKRSACRAASAACVHDSRCCRKSPTSSSTRRSSPARSRPSSSSCPKKC